MRVYCLSGLGRASTGPLHKILFSLVKDYCASDGIRHPEYRESFRNRGLRGAKRVA